MYHIRSLVVVILLLLCGKFSFAQNQYNIDYITAESGLPSDGIKGLKWDEQNGYLWIATEGGMVRYNGQQMFVFNKENMPSANVDRFSLAKDLHGHVVAITNSSIFEVRENWLYPSHIRVPGPNQPTGSQLYVFVAQGPPPGANPHINNFDKILPIDSTHCVVDKSDSLYEYRSGEAKTEGILAVDHQRSSFMIGKSIFIFDDNNKFSNFIPGTRQLVELNVTPEIEGDKKLPSGKKHLYWEAGMDKPIILAGTYAWTLDFKNGQIVTKLICTEIPQNFAIKYIQYWEKGEILFLGTQSKGIIVIRKNYLSSVKKNNSGFDEPNAIYSQILLSNGNILTNTGDIIGPYQGKVKDMPTGRSDNGLPKWRSFSNNVLLTKDSVLWFTAFDSLFSYDYKTRRRTFTTHYDGSYYISFAVTKNKVFAASYKGIMQVVDTGVISLCTYKGLGDPFDMAELEPGVLALATSKGLFRYYIAGNKLDTLLKCESPVRSLWKYRSYLFIGTYGDGIYILKDGIVKHMPLDNNNYLRYAHCFILDKYGFCWISTNRGLFKARLQDMLDAYEFNTPYIYYHFFGKNEGMDITEMNGGCKPCGIELLNGNISFPTMDGALWVDPNTPLRLPDGNVSIDQVIANGKKIDNGNIDSLKFGSSIHDISINVAFSSWCDKENVYVQYTLDTQSANWQKMDVNHPVIHLSNLPYGKCDLYIRKLKGFGTHNFDIKKISFEIAAPWYLMWWGEVTITLTAILVITIIAIIANRESLRRQRRLRNQLDRKTKEILKQNEKLEKNDRIKTRLISIISHDIITPLKYLHLTTKYLAEEKASLSDNLRDETLIEVVNTSRELELLSTNILNWIKYQNEERRIVKEKINLHDLAEQIFIMLKSLAHKNNTELINGIPHDITIVQFTDPLRIILYNLLVNAINFTKDGSIIITASNLYENMQIQVKDTGLGMNKTQIRNLVAENVIMSSANVNKRSGNGLGYLIIKDLLKMIDGTFDIESTVGLGTSVYITFPAK